MLLAYSAATTDISSNVSEWETADGLPAWIAIPRLVPIAWDYDFYKKICDFIETEDQALQRIIEARRRARGEDI